MRKRSQDTAKEKLEVQTQPFLVLSTSCATAEEALGPEGRMLIKSFMEKTMIDIVLGTHFRSCFGYSWIFYRTLVALFFIGVS